MSKKFLFTLIGVVALIGVGTVWMIRGVADAALWGLWFGGLNALIGVYAGANVMQKKVISENYHPEIK